MCKVLLNLQALKILVNMPERESNFAMLERYVHGDSTRLLLSGSVRSGSLPCMKEKDPPFPVPCIPFQCPVSLP